jgi:RNase H-fold protein (predicted Holliday junction resolvase)
MKEQQFSLTQPMILGFDPGKDKCGVAVMGVDRQLYYHEVVLSQNAIAQISQLRQKFPISLLVMGDQTTAKRWKKQLNDELPEPINIILVDERYSTLEARDRYWQMYPPKGLTKLLPEGMRQPPRPIDDIVAILLIERYLARLTATSES